MSAYVGKTQVPIILETIGKGKNSANVVLKFELSITKPGKDE